MSGLVVQLNALPRPEDTPLSTPQPVYEQPVRGVTPQAMRFEERGQARNAALRAMKLYPGAVGEILASELHAFAEMGYLGHSTAPIRRLIAELLRENA